MGPRAFPHGTTVDTYFRGWRSDGTWQQMHMRRGRAVGRNAGRRRAPRAMKMDRQTGGTGEGGAARGEAAGKSAAGRKRHGVVATVGFGVCVIGTAAHLHDRHGGKMVVRELFQQP